jgi:hypothetical protein
MMTQFHCQTKKILRPLLLAMLILVSAPVFVILDHSWPKSTPTVAAVPEFLDSPRTTVIYKS